MTIDAYSDCTLCCVFPKLTTAKWKVNNLLLELKKRNRISAWNTLFSESWFALFIKYYNNQLWAINWAAPALSKIASFKLAVFHRFLSIIYRLVNQFNIEGRKLFRVANRFLQMLHSLCGRRSKGKVEEENRRREKDTRGTQGRRGDSSTSLSSSLP